MADSSFPREDSCLNQVAREYRDNGLFEQDLHSLDGNPPTLSISESQSKPATCAKTVAEAYADYFSLYCGTHTKSEKQAQQSKVDDILTACSLQQARTEARNLEAAQDQEDKVALLKSALRPLNDPERNMARIVAHEHWLRRTPEAREQNAYVFEPIKRRELLEAALAVLPQVIAKRESNH